MKDLVKQLIDISSEIKLMNKVQDFSSLPGLIERYQTLANRLEAALSDKQDVAHYSQKRHDLRKECKELKKEIDALKKEKAELKGEEPKIERDWDLG